LRPGVLAVNFYFALLCALASLRLIFHRKGLKSTAKAQRRKGKTITFFVFAFKSLALLCALASLRLIFHRKGAKEKQ